MGDHGRMYQIGQIDADKALVSFVAYESLKAALETVAPNASLGDRHSYREISHSSWLLCGLSVCWTWSVTVR